MKSSKFVHIDYGSSGTAGLYLAQILKAYSGEIPVDAYVHSNFPKVNTHAKIFRIFDKFSRFVHGEKFKKIIKAIDLYISFIYLIYVVRYTSKKYKIYVFVQFFQSFHAYKFLFSRLKKYCILIVTVHDAVELEHNYPSFIMSSRDKIINNAHCLLVHNSDSMNKLNYLGKTIYKIPFPLMTDDSLNSTKELEDDKVKFLFIGHIRYEKGIDDLVTAWRRLSAEVLEKASLIIAGTYDSKLNIDFTNLLNCTILLKYLSDEEFIQLIKSCHYVVLPYRGGTNSGVLSMSSALGRPSITSRLPIFTESPFFDELLSFEPLSDISELLSNVVKNHSLKYDFYLKRNSLHCEHFQSEFRSSICELYEKIIKI